MKQSIAAAGLFILALTGPSASGAAAKHEMAAKEAVVQVQTALSGAGSSGKETNFGNLVADAVRQTGGAQAALVPADEIDGGTSIPPGKSTAGRIVAALHYADDPSDTVVVLTLTGAQLLKAAERSVSRAPEPFDGFLQLSGLQIRYHSGQPQGKRVSLVGIGGGEVEAEKSYRVATTRSLAGGGLGYFQIWTSKDIAGDTGVSVADSLRNYLSAHPVVSSTVEGRIAAQ